MKGISVSKMHPQRFRLILALSILVSCVGCDQATKTVATYTLRDQPPQSYLSDTVRLDFAQNPGGLLSLGANLPDSFRSTLFIVSNCGMMLGLCVFLLLKRNISGLLFVSLVSILSGGIGNLFDRIANHGLVTDFINIGIGPIRTGVFNVADMAITFGAILIGLQAFKRDLNGSSDSSMSSFGPNPPGDD